MARNRSPNGQPRLRPARLRATSSNSWRPAGAQGTRCICRLPKTCQEADLHRVRVRGMGITRSPSADQHPDAPMRIPNPRLTRQAPRRRSTCRGRGAGARIGGLRRPSPKNSSPADQPGGPRRSPSCSRSAFHRLGRLWRSRRVRQAFWPPPSSTRRPRPRFAPRSMMPHSGLPAASELGVGRGARHATWRSAGSQRRDRSRALIASRRPFERERRASPPHPLAVERYVWGSTINLLNRAMLCGLRSEDRRGTLRRGAAMRRLYLRAQPDGTPCQLPASGARRTRPLFCARQADPPIPPPPGALSVAQQQQYGIGCRKSR